MPTIRLRRDELHKLIDAVKEKKGFDGPTWQVFFGYYHICLPSMATPFTVACWEAYQRTGALNNETYESYGRLPAILVEAVNIIQAEERRIEGIRETAQKDNAARRSAHKPRSRGRGSKWH